MHLSRTAASFAGFIFAALLISCRVSTAPRHEAASEVATSTVLVTPVRCMPLGRDLNLSAELVPFQEVDVFAKESGYVSQLLVDYGSHVRKGQLLAVLEIPELRAVLEEDNAAIKSASDQVTSAQHRLNGYQAQHDALHLQYKRLNDVAVSQPGLVAQQEVDDAKGKDLAAESQIESAKANLELAQSQLAQSRSKLGHDQVLYDYSKITAPFSGVVTQRYANLGTLLQAGTNSSTQAMPLVRLSQEDLFRLVIPVPEGYVSYIKQGDSVSVKVPALNRTFPGTVARFAADVNTATRTMHTEVDVPNPSGVLMPGLYAEANLTLDRKEKAIVVPVQAVVEKNGHNLVYIVDALGKVQVRTVTLGIRTDTNAEVLSGLSKGEQVIVSDTTALHSGQAVQSKLAKPETPES